jgi:carboxyl-terminal processing protease
MRFAWIVAWLFAASLGLGRADDVVQVPGLAGIGAVLIERNGTAIISQVLPKSPAAEAGLQPQDAIVWVDYRDVAGMELADVVSLIRGDEGSTVAISILRPGESKPRTFTLTRRPIVINP